MTGEALTIERLALEQLAALLLERAGLKVTPDGYAGLRLALQARMPATGLDDAAEYVRRLRQLAGEHELRALLPLVTVGKTEFFRDSRQFAAFENEIFPELLKHARREARPVRAWSAGCATGEEPYSIAMVGLDRGALPNELDCWATDLNPVAVQNAARGRFAIRRLLGVSEPRLARFFNLVDGFYEVTPQLREMVRFDGHNLAAPIWPQVRPQSMDLIFCRNVIIYFDQPTILAVMDRFYDSLRPGGWLFLGYSESLFRLPTRFEMVEVGGVFIYRRPVRGGVTQVLTTVVRGAGEPAPAPPPAQATTAASLPAPPAVARPPERATPKALPLVVGLQLPRSTASMPSPALSKPRPPGTGTPVERLEQIVADIERGDFPRALRLSHALAEDAPDDLAARITLGNVHALMGNIAEAREAYQAALQREPLSVEARLYLGIAALQGLEPEIARQEFTRALFLEPTLALGHYLLAQVHERRGDAEAARRSYRNAINLRKGPPHALLGHFPDLPTSNEAIAQAAQYRLAALSER
ncbi:MAG: tetratricopeptide repeat protein [Myxococcus sp.]|nr:tetratricopeptide repeat protein [Myxococcus sp.]